MRIALYARVSTKDKGQTNDNQLRELRAFAERLGYTIYKGYPPATPRHRAGPCLSFTLLALTTPSQDLRQATARSLPPPLRARARLQQRPSAWGSQLVTTEQRVTLSLSPDLVRQLDLLQPTTGLGNRPVFLRHLLESALQQLQAKRDGGLLQVECQPGEGPKFERLAKERHMP